MGKNNIKKLREQMGLKQKDLAQMVGVSDAYISMCESKNRTPSFEVSLKMCDVFGCTVDYLLNATDESSDMEEYMIALRNSEERRKLLDMTMWMPKEKLQKLLKLIEVWNE